MRLLVLVLVSSLAACASDATKSGADVAGDAAGDAAVPSDGDVAADAADVSLDAGPGDAATDATDTTVGDTVGDTVDAASPDADPGDAPVDAAPDADVFFEPVVVNAWKAGTNFAVAPLPGTVTDAAGDLSPGEIEDLLDQGVLVLLVADGDGGATPWVYFGPSGTAVQATGSTADGAPLDLTFTAWSGEACQGTNIEEAHLLLDGLDTDGDGAVDKVEGTWAGTVSTIDGDCICDATSFTAQAAGVRDAKPPSVYASPSGSWPNAGYVIGTGEPVLGAALAAATDQIVDDEVVPFTLAPVGPEAPPGAASAWRIVPDAPYAPGVQLIVSVGPVADLAGNVSPQTPDSAYSIGTLPPAKIGASWDFSGGSPFATSGYLEVAPSFGTVDAPSGGAMGILAVDPYAPLPIDAGLDIPKYKTLLRVTMAVAVSGDVDFGYAESGVQVLMAGASAAATLPVPATHTEIQIDETVWLVSPFATVDVNITDLANMKGLLRIGFTPDPSASQNCLPYTPDTGGARILIDKIQVI